MQLPQEPEIRQQIEKIFSSARFKDASRARRFLEFVVEEALAGKGAELKENIVGVNVFDRSPDYDPRLDSIVRVEAGRLRAKLQEYYSVEGCDDQVVLVLPKGGYAPEFTWRVALQPTDLTSQLESTSSAPSRTSADQARRFSTRHVIAFALALGVLAVGFTLASAWLARREASEQVRIAVLPFTPYSPDSSDQVTATQLTQKVTAEFVRLGTFNVVPSTSARQFSDRRPGVREIATALQADILLEARLETHGSSMRVEVVLSAGALDRKFWATDKFAGASVDELAREIALAANSAVSKQLAKTPTLQVDHHRP